MLKAMVLRTPLWLFKTSAFQAFLYHVYYRYHCPGSNLMARECVGRGECGCDNLDRYAPNVRS